MTVIGQSAPVQIFCKGLTGTTRTIVISLDATIGDLQRRILEIEHIPVDQQRILFGGTQRGKDRTLSQCGIQKEATVHLVLKLAGGGFEFNDFSKPSDERAFTATAPIWRRVRVGLNLKGICRHAGCDAVGKEVIIKFGLNDGANPYWDLKQCLESACCPVVTDKIPEHAIAEADIITAIFSSCRYEIIGLKANEGGQYDKKETEVVGKVSEGRWMEFEGNEKATWAYTQIIAQPLKKKDK